MIELIDLDLEKPEAVKKKFIQQLEKNLNGAKIATISGRYYAMDRDKRWSRIKKSYDAMVNSIGEKSEDIIDKIQSYYDKNITDEFILKRLEL